MLQVIGTLEELRVLSVHGDAVTDVGVAAIASLPHLESLDLSRTSVTSEGLAVLARTDTLRELTLDGVRNRGDELSLRGLAALSDLPRFTSLRARHRSLDSVATLAALPHLSTLDLEHCAGLRDLQGLAGLKELRTLDLSNTDATDLRGLERLTQLEELDLGGTYPSHRETLGRLQRLRRLALDHVHLSWDDIVPLRSLPQLEAISAYNSGLDCTGEDLLVCDFIHTW